MTLTASAHTGEYASTPEVVAGLINDGFAAQVAATAVRLARETGARVRFVQVLPDGLSAEDKAEAESTTFAVALKALRGRPRVQATFEAPTGDPRMLLVQRSRGAMALVLGEDHPGILGYRGFVTEYCRAHARCRVHVVTAS